MASYAEWAARWRVPLHFVLAAVVLLLALPQPRWLAAGAGLVTVGVLVRAWAAGHLRRDPDPSGLTVSGPYAHLRHPLYFGSALILLGFAAASGRVSLAALLAAYFLFLFVPVLRREERNLRAAFPEEYSAFAARVPAFLPRLTPARGLGEASAQKFDGQLYLRNQEWRSALGSSAALALLYAKMLWG